MTWLVLQTAAWLASAMLAGAVAYFGLRLAIRVLRTRAHELKTARLALTEYETAFDVLMSDPATPDSARRLLEEFDRGILDRGAAYFVASSIFRDRESWISPRRDAPVTEDMRELGKHRPDLYEAFSVAISRGFIATMFRWFWSAAALRFLIVDLKNDPITPARAMACGAADRHHPPGALPQAA